MWLIKQTCKEAGFDLRYIFLLFKFSPLFTDFVSRNWENIKQFSISQDLCLLVLGFASGELLVINLNHFFDFAFSASLSVKNCAKLIEFDLSQFSFKDNKEELNLSALLEPSTSSSTTPISSVSSYSSYSSFSSFSVLPIDGKKEKAASMEEKKPMVAMADNEKVNTEKWWDKQLFFPRFREQENTNWIQKLEKVESEEIKRDWISNESSNTNKLNGFTTQYHSTGSSSATTNSPGTNSSNSPTHLSSEEERDPKKDSSDTGTECSYLLVSEKKENEVIKEVHITPQFIVFSTKQPRTEIYLHNRISVKTLFFLLSFLMFVYKKKEGHFHT